MTSPLRYPGGKTRACKILDTHVPNKPVMLSPFFGGGSFELFRGGKWFANDLFLPVFTFWTELKQNPLELRQEIEALRPVTKDDFLYIRKNLSHVPIKLAAQFFAINRSSFSGSTFCGGYSQESANRRFTDSCIQRLLRVNLKDVEFTNMDAIDFLKLHPETDETWIYADPPYYIDSYIYGKDGDMHENFNHCAFAEYIKTRSDWTLCYNDCEYIRKLYSGCNIINVNWSYGMNALKKSSEIIIKP